MMNEDFLAAVIEDDLFTRKILLRYFSRHGLRASGFASGEEFILQLNNLPFTHLITDVNLPGMSGYEIGDIVRNDFPGIYRIVMTSPNDATEIDHFLEKGFDDVLLKPVSEDDLLEAIQVHRTGFRFPTIEAMIEDPRERKEILQNLVTESRADANAIRLSISGNDLTHLILLVHRFVGRFAQFDQHDLSEEFRNLESALQAGIPVHSLAGELESAIVRLLDFTDELQAELYSMP